MKKLILLFTLICFTNCYYYKNLNKGDIVNFYTNYSATISGGDNIYYIYPDVGQINFRFIFTNSNSYGSRTVYIDPMTGSDSYYSITSGWYFSRVTFTFKIPETNPSILKLVVAGHTTEIMYLYAFNVNYKIPLSLSNYYLYQIILIDLEINYEITVLDDNVNINFESTIEYPQYQDTFNLTVNDNNYIFNESSQLSLSLKKGTTYTIKFKAVLLSSLTLNSYFFIYLGRGINDNTLYYPNNNLTYTTILSNHKWFIIDTINSIDNYNRYKLSIIEGFKDEISNNFNIRVKKYDTYNIDYIKNNLPLSNDDYDEYLNLDYEKSLIFQVCENCLNSRTILIQIDLKYKYADSLLYKYNIEKMKPDPRKTLEFTKYDINWYLNYEFNPMSVQSLDFILISTNHSNTVFPSKLEGNKLFESFYNGQLFVSYPNQDTKRNKVAVDYSITDAIILNDRDVGHMEVYKFDNPAITFEVINIDEEIQNKLIYRSFEKKVFIINFVIMEWKPGWIKFKGLYS